MFISKTNYSSTEVLIGKESKDKFLKGNFNNRNNYNPTILTPHYHVLHCGILAIIHSSTSKRKQKWYQ